MYYLYLGIFETLCNNLDWSCYMNLWQALRIKICYVELIISSVSSQFTILKLSENSKSSGLVTLNVSQSVVVKLSWNVLCFLCFADSDDWARYRADLSSLLEQQIDQRKNPFTCPVEQTHAFLQCLTIHVAPTLLVREVL